MITQGRPQGGFPKADGGENNQNKLTIPDIVFHGMGNKSYPYYAENLKKTNLR